MDLNIISLIATAVALVIGVVLGKFLFAKNTKKQVEEAQNQAQVILREAELRAETIKKERELDAKEKFVQMKAAHDKDVMMRNQKIVDSEYRYAEAV